MPSKKTTKPADKALAKVSGSDVGAIISGIGDAIKAIFEMAVAAGDVVLVDKLSSAAGLLKEHQIIARDEALKAKQRKKAGA